MEGRLDRKGVSNAFIEAVNYYSGRCALDEATRGLLVWVV